ncbi:MAG: hypothetical protein E6G67_07480 [Actinobacteria bacterium]|nr:MAG: hypothetical protein E6G67_07480 [Actinomycetota bacterium]
MRLLLLPARQFPRLALHDITIRAGHGGESPLGGASIAWLDLEPENGGVHLAARGALSLARDVPFELGFDYGRDDRLTGGARFMIPSAPRGRLDSLRVSVDGRVTQARGRGLIELGDSSRVTIGRLPLVLQGSLARAGPHARFALSADGVTPARLLASFPQSVLGTLRDLSLRGSFDYRLSLDLDLSAPERVDFTARVLPHGLALDSARTRLNLLALDQPFTATIHLPGGRLETRELSPANPHFRTLDQIDSMLVHAVVTNEDGGFFRHRGFNVEAVKSAIAENLRAGAYRRGAGTITMQLVRNLYLGHERTLSRKAQEVALAWVLEHLTGISKRRLLEIYLNVIEWGPGIQGADEAARYYFDRDASDLDLGEALFLSTVVPSPSKWRYRFDPLGELKPFARAQMHFIGRAMIAKGWLAPEELPPRDSIRVELRGAARAVISPPPDLTQVGVGGARRLGPRAGAAATTLVPLGASTPSRNGISLEGNRAFCRWTLTGTSRSCRSLESRPPAYECRVASRNAARASVRVESIAGSGDSAFGTRSGISGSAPRTPRRRPLRRAPA